MEILFLKGDRGCLVPMNDDEEEKAVRHFKRGAVIRGQFANMRNGGFHRKFFILRDFLFDIWADGLERMYHKGQEIQPDKERFRKDLLILAGFYDVVINWRGESRLEAKSMSFASMEQDEFEKLFSACINVGLAKILRRPDLTAESVRAHCDRLMEFDR